MRRDTQKRARTLKKKIKEEKLVIGKADKGNSMVTIEKEEYDKKF